MNLHAYFARWNKDQRALFYSVTAEGARFELAVPCGTVDFKSTALDQLCDPSLFVLRYTVGKLSGAFSTGAATFFGRNQTR